MEFANRVPDWCVVVGLIGTGQEIHVGEEAGIGQWRRAVDNNSKWQEWRMHIPSSLLPEFSQSPVPVRTSEALTLDVELRQHTAKELHRFVAGLLAVEPAQTLVPLARQLEKDGFHLRITRELDVAKTYLRERYAENSDARFGIVASARDKALAQFAIENDFRSTQRVKMGPWYGDGDNSPFSCRRLTSCVAEFGAQGLELDAVLVAWGTDLRLARGKWSNADATRYKMKRLVRDALQLRVNAYRVLLTRARDATVIFIPPLAQLDETHAYLVSMGWQTLKAAGRL